MLSRINWYLSHWKYLLSIFLGLSGHTHFSCPICGYNGSFRAYGLPPRFNAQCPSCGSLERHRLFKLLSEQHGWFCRIQSVLHFAPEQALSILLKDWVKEYQSADILSSADLILDIEDIAMPDFSYDAIVCSHVLEHVDDNKALREIFRILKPGGVVFAMVPVCEGWDYTYEDTSITDPSERALHFGQNDHLRYYGHDFSTRFFQNGFITSEFAASPSDCVRFALLRGEKVYVGIKPIC